MLTNVPKGRLRSASSDDQTKEKTVIEKIASNVNQTKGAMVIDIIASSDKQTKGARLENDISRHHSDLTLGNSPGKRSENVREGVKVREIIWNHFTFD